METVFKKYLHSACSPLPVKTFLSHKKVDEKLTSRRKGEVGATRRGGRPRGADIAGTLHF